MKIIFSLLIICFYTHANEINHNNWISNFKEKNLSTQIEIKKLEQSRLHIKQQLARLIPSLNLGTVADTAVNGPVGLVSGLSNFVGFIMPSRWFNWEESKMFYLSQFYSYMAIKGNYILLAEEIFLAAKRNKMIINVLDQQIEVLNDLGKSVEFREKIGELPKGSFARIHAFELKLRHDYQQLLLIQNIYITEMNKLIQDNQLNLISGIDITTPRDFTAIEDFSFEKYKDQILEIQSVNSLYVATKFSKKSRTWSFIDFSGEGFGLGYFVNNSIADVELKTIELTRTKTILDAKVQFQVLNQEENSIIQQLNTLNEGVNLIDARLEQILIEYKISGLINIDDYLENISNFLEFKSKYIYTEIKLDYLQANKERITLENFYQNLEEDIPARNLKKLKRYQRREEKLIEKYFQNN